MAIELHTLLGKASHMGIKSLTDTAESTVMVSWVHIIDGPAAIPYVGIGELVITTGSGIVKDTDDLLLPFIRELWERNAAGIILNIGPYISSVPRKLIDFCQEQHFPLYAVPWETHISELMQTFCFALAEERQRGTDTVAAFKNAILFPDQPELYAVALSQSDFQMEWAYAAVVIQPEDCTRTDEKSVKLLTYRMDNFLHHNYRHSISFRMDDDIVIVIGNCDDKQLHTIVEGIRGLLSSGQNQTSYLIGSGRLTQSIRCLCKSWSQARSIVNLHRNGKINPDMIFYSEMGVYKLLMCIEDTEILQEYFDSTIRPLKEYDAKKQTNLTEVVECYLNHNGSVKEVAGELYLHRNTINYRINKAEEILHMNLSHHDARFRIEMGFLVQDLLR